MAWRTLERRFFARPALDVARSLLGQVLVVQPPRGGSARTARIVETEAYVGPHDLAAHSSKGRTARTEVMFGPPGHVYVFLIYGMHLCFNIVTGDGAAVLIRAVEPLENVEGRTDGPGRLTRALGITMKHNTLPLRPAGPIFVARGARVARIARGPRIGVDYAGVWAGKPYRFWERGNPHVSLTRK